MWRCLNEHGARIFGFDGAQIDFWREVLPNVLSSSCDFVGQLPPVLGAPGSPPQPELLTFRSIWSQAEARDARLALPDAEPSAEKHVREEALYWRKVVATVLGQYMRLSDAAIDLYFADRRAERQGGTIVDHFLDWLTSTDVDSRGLHKVWQDWIAHHTLIFLRPSASAKTSVLQTSLERRVSISCTTSIRWWASLVAQADTNVPCSNSIRLVSRTSWWARIQSEKVSTSICSAIASCTTACRGRPATWSSAWAE